VLGIVHFVDAARSASLPGAATSATGATGAGAGGLAGLSAPEQAFLGSLYPLAQASPGSPLEATLRRIQATLVLPAALFVRGGGGGGGGGDSLSLEMAVADAAAESAAEREDADAAAPASSSAQAAAAQRARAERIGSTRELAAALCRELLRSEGDALRHLAALGVSLAFKQTRLHEQQGHWGVGVSTAAVAGSGTAPGASSALAADLRDGCRLMRLGEVLAGAAPLSLAQHTLIVPAATRTSRLHNAAQALSFLGSAYACLLYTSPSPRD
jgi:hypothetical protein